MLELVLKLLDRLIDLAKRKEELDRRLFGDFVEPAFRAFEIVHTDYIDSLQRYLTHLEDKSIPMDMRHPVFGEIEVDSLKTEHLRTRLLDFKPTSAPPKLKPLLTMIDEYLRAVLVSRSYVEDLASGEGPHHSYLIGEVKLHEFGPTLFHYDPIRRLLRHELMVLDMCDTRSEGGRRIASSLMIKETIRVFQEAYAPVSAAYAKLRHDLLSA